jgi:hypothetical protein
MKKYILGIIALIVIALVGINQYQDAPSVGSDAVTPIAGQTYTLSGSGVSSSDTSITLTSLTITQTGYEILDSDMSETFYVTLEPGSRSRQEIVSCTTVTQNAGDTATLSGCVRGLTPFSPYSASTEYSFAHSGGSTVIFSNPPQLYNQAAFKDNDETITGSWLFPTPLGDYNAATKSYVDTLVTGGTVSNDRLIVAGTAGETLATSTLVYFKGTDQEWYKVDTDDSTTYNDVFIGLTQGSGVDTGTINNGILLKGRDTTQTGLTAGSTYYATTSAGSISTTASVQPIGTAEDTNVLYFDPVMIGVPRLAMNNTFTGNNTFSGTTIFSGGITGQASTSLRVYTATSTWTKPAGLEYITTWVCGAGGSGAGGTGGSDAGGGGGSGGCAFEMLSADELSGTTSISIGVSTGPGGSTFFGTFSSSTSGVSAVGISRGSGGVASGGDLNFNGSGGGGGFSGSAGEPGGGSGASSQLGIGGGGGNSGGNADAGTGYGSGGGGGGGSSGGSSGSGGSGAQGVVIVTEYY